MQRFKRPPEPADFSAKVEAEREIIRNHFEKPAAVPVPAAPPLPPVPGEEEAGGKIKFSAKWTDFKPAFAEAQYGKCGYCEMMVTGGQNGDVEHFFPKGEVWQLDDNDPSTWGKERNWASTVEGRKKQVVSEQGYWWMAYDWSNYLLSCAVCNEYWKLSYFPVKDRPRKVPPSNAIAETALLLNPFDEKAEPAEHLKFDKLGQIEARDKSIYGFETIRTCGLDRESLRRARSEKAQRAYYLLTELNETGQNDKDKLTRILTDFHTLAKDEFIHSGMVRIIFEQGSGMKWSDLEGLIKT